MIASPPNSPPVELIAKPPAQRLHARLKASAFIKNVLIVMSGTAVAQAIGFALAPVISRLFSPADFGVFGSFNSIAGMIAAGVTLDYTQAIMLPKDKQDAFHLFLASCISTLVFGCLCLLACILMPGTLNGLMKTSGIGALALLVFATVVSGFNASCQAWCVRSKAFKHTAASQVIRSVSANGMQVGLGSLKAGAPGLIISGVLADALASVNLLRVLIPDARHYRALIRWERIKQLAKEYRDFPMYSASQNVINAVSSGLPVLLLAHYYGIAVAGAYAFGMRILTVPMGFVLTALRQVLFQKAGETQHQGRGLMPLYVKTTAGLFALGLLPSLVLLAWAPQLFSWVFGARWIAAGEIARWLAPWLLFAFCNLPAILFSRLIRIQRAVFFYDLVLLAARTASLVLGGLYLNTTQTIMIFSLTGAIMNFLLIVIVGYALVVKEKGKTTNA